MPAMTREEFDLMREDIDVLLDIFVPERIANRETFLADKKAEKDAAKGKGKASDATPAPDAEKDADNKDNEDHQE